MKTRSIFTLCLAGNALCAALDGNTLNQVKPRDTLRDNSSFSLSSTESAAANNDDPCGKDINDSLGKGPRKDCKHVNQLNDKGNCPVQTKSKRCSSYCEQERTTFLADEQRLSDVIPGMSKIAPGVKISLQGGVSFTIEKQLELGITAAFKDIVSAGLNYKVTTSKTKSTTIALSVDESKQYYSSWVMFPAYVQSCGIVTENQEIMTPETPRVPSYSRCGPKVEKSSPVCSTSARLTGSGQQDVMFAVRYEDDKGNVVPLSKQHETYRRVCRDFKADKDWMKGKGKCAAAYD